MLKKLLASTILASFLLVTLLIPIASAQSASTWYNQSPYEWYTKVYDQSVSPANEIFGERYTKAQVEWVIYSLLTWPSTKVLGPDLASCLVTFAGVEACIGDFIKSITMNNNVPGGPTFAAGDDRNLFQLVFQERSFSGIGYFRDLAKKFNIIPRAEAQEGFGYTEALSPIRGLWRASRNTAYGLMVFVALALAFMVMFRVKTAPQVVVTIQSALPKLVIAVVLVTFSYAIAGFLIDLMYVVIGLISLMARSWFPPVLGLSQEKIFNFLTLGQPFSFNFSLGAMGLFLLYLLFFFIAMFVVFAAMLGIVGSIAIGLFSLLTYGILPLLFLLLALILFILIIIWFLKTVFVLFKAYGSIILLTIFAPFFLLLGAIVPGFGFGRWAKSFVANLAVFVVVGLMFLLAYMFVIQAALYAVHSVIGDAPTFAALARLILGTSIAGLGSIFTGSRTAGWPPLLAIGGNAEASISFLFLGVSFIIFTLIPKTADMIQGLISGRPLAYGTAIGEAIGQPLGAGIRGVSIASEIGRAWTTRLGTRAYPAPPPKGSVPTTPQNT